MKEETIPSPKIACVVLAAGKGTRMKSSLPKVMHKVAGTPMLLHVLGAAKSLGAEKTVTILAPDMQSVATLIKQQKLGAVAIQDKQLGTGHAVRCTEDALKGFSGTVLILYGDMPLVKAETLQKLLDTVQGPRSPSMAVLGFMYPDQNSYGRLLLDKQGKLQAIIEAAEATPDQLDISLCNAGIMAVPSALLFSWLGKLTDSNRKKEFYLTDIVAIAREEQRSCGVVVADYHECQGVNSRDDLAEANMIYQSRLRQQALDAGVTMTDPSTVYFSADTKIAADVIIHPHVVFGPGVTIDTDVEIRSFSHIEGAHIKKGAIIGPFARLRPGAVIGEEVHIGNFVEIKNSSLARGAKANHLSYIGDASVGENANIGAGTITANYDGMAKHHTRIGANASIGSNTVLVAPVAVGDGAVTGAGSIIREDVEGNALVLTKGQQVVKPGWVAKKLAKKKH